MTRPQRTLIHPHTARHTTTGQGKEQRPGGSLLLGLNTWPALHRTQSFVAAEQLLQLAGLRLGDAPPMVGPLARREALRRLTE